MKNIILYSDRYQSVRLIENDTVEFKYLTYSSINEIDFYINTEIVNKYFIDEKFDNIFIPLSPFGSYSDYLGLRIAMYLKFCQSKSKLANIFVYGISNISELLNNECFDSLKFSEVNAIAFSNDDFKNNLKINITIDDEKWYQQVSNLNLKIPEDYFDDHSIANEWGIFQMARSAGVDINNIDGFDLQKFNRLYFKWLIAKNDLFESISEKQQQEQKSYADKLPGVKVVGKIELPQTKMK